MKNLFKKLAVFLAVCMLLQCAALPAFATEADAPANDIDGFNYMDDVTYLDENGIKQTKTCTFIRNSEGRCVSLESGWYYVDGTVLYDDDIYVTGDAHLVLKDGCKFLPKDSAQHIFLGGGDNASLTVYGQDKGNGILTSDFYGASQCFTVNGGTVKADAGIKSVQIVVNRGSLEVKKRMLGDNLVTINGGSVTAANIISKNVTINGGTVTTIGSEFKAGINSEIVNITGGTVTAGSGDGAGITGGSITISGGEVTATGSGGGAGIGGNARTSGGTINISGGTVVATGSTGAAGIGSGDWVSETGSPGIGGNITISGGIVTANGGSEGAGIGGGNHVNGGYVTISGGTVTANGGLSGAGIGGGSDAQGASVTITGGTVNANGGRHGAGIGGGSLKQGRRVDILGGTVTAVSGGDADSIGGGYQARASSSVPFNVGDDLMIFAGKTREAARSTTLEEYSNNREEFACIGPKAVYTVKHQWQKADGTGYEEKEQESLYGVVGFHTEAQQKSYEGFTCEGVTQQTVAADNSTEVPVKYKRNFYDITFDSKGIGTAPENITARFGAEVTLNPDNLTAAGYIFNGWFKDAECTERYTFPHTLAMPAGGLTIHAGWTGRTDTPYTVKHYKQNADGTGYELAEETPMTGTSGQQTAAEAKTYQGFWAKPFSQQPISGDGSTVVEIYYDRNRSTITFDVKGHGTAPAPITAIPGTPVSAPVSPTAEGYIFGGWYSDDALTKRFVFSTMPGENLTLFAKWAGAADNFTVTWMLDEYTSIDSTVVRAGEMPVHADAEMPGCVFTGWGPALAPVTGDITYTAKFHAITERVALSFNTVYGSYVDTQVVNRGEKAEEPAAIPDKEGFTFAGWYTDTSYSTAFDFDSAITDNTVACAKWQAGPAVSFTITWQMDNGTLIDKTTAAKGELPSHEEPVKKDCVFTGWTPEPVPAAENATYTAVFRAKGEDEASVSFETNGGSSVRQQIVKKGEKASRPSNPEKSGYSFENWYADKELTAVYDFNTAVTADIILYAKWRKDPVVYTITEGADSVWTKGGTTGAAFVSNAPFAKFKDVKVDGNTINVSNYTVKEGSTRVSFSAGYMETLSIGAHTLEIVSADGSASAGFSVKAADTKYYTVSFNMNGHGSGIASQSVKEGEKAARPSDPSESGYTFRGWYADQNLTAAFDFNTAIYGNTVIYAKWDKNGTDPKKGPATGDESSGLLWLMLMSVSAASLGGTVAYRRKRSR